MGVWIGMGVCVCESCPSSWVFFSFRGFLQPSMVTEIQTSQWSAHLLVLARASVHNGRLWVGVWETNATYNWARKWTFSSVLIQALASHSGGATIPLFEL